jgi:hypothetical protein
MDHRSIEHFHIHYIPGKLQWKYLRKMLEWQGFPIQEDLQYNPYENSYTPSIHTSRSR